MAVVTDKLDALTSALNRSAERLQTLWFSFLAVTVFLGIAAFTTTHRMLLLEEEGQSLPLLNIKLPLLPFYLIGPFIYVVMHAYILMMLVLLARTAHIFEEALTAVNELTKQDREDYRMRLENAIFLQIIAGALPERVGINGIILRAIALVTLAVVPVLVLLLFQLQFLPYHDQAVTWWHRALVLADLVLVWTLWATYRRNHGEWRWPELRPMWALAFRGVTSLAILVFSVFIATFPYEAIHANPVSTSAPWITGFLFGELGDEKAADDARNQGVFANRLWLPGEVLVDSTKLKRIEADINTVAEGRQPVLLDLSRRDLSGANFNFADLRRVKITGPLRDVTMKGASLQGADLSGIEIDVNDALATARLEGAVLRNAQLEGAKLYAANLQGADLSNANLRGANLISAQLQGATLHSAQLQEANLQSAKLQGADLREAHLQGAHLHSVRLDGAWATGSRFQGANLRKATARGATLDSANFQGANLMEAGLEGSSLASAQLEGATLRHARLHGASLLRTQLNGASLRQASVWRAYGFLLPDHTETVILAHMDHMPFNVADVGGGSLVEWRKMIVSTIPGEKRRTEAERLLMQLDENQRKPSNLFNRLIPKSFWDDLEQKQLSGTAFQDALTKRLGDLICSNDEDAAYVAVGILRSPLEAEINRSNFIKLLDQIDDGRVEAQAALSCPAARQIPLKILKESCANPKIREAARLCRR